MVCVYSIRVICVEPNQVHPFLYCSFFLCHSSLWNRSAWSILRYRGWAWDTMFEYHSWSQPLIGCWPMSDNDCSTESVGSTTAATRRILIAIGHQQKMSFHCYDIIMDSFMECLWPLPFSSVNNRSSSSSESNNSMPPRTWNITMIGTDLLLLYMPDRLHFLKKTMSEPVRECWYSMNIRTSPGIWHEECSYDHFVNHIGTHQSIVVERRDLI
jgi:hypothetical protein